MSYLAPSKLLTNLSSTLEAKFSMANRETLITAYITGLAFALIIVLALSFALKTGDPLTAALILPVSLAMLYLAGFNVLGELFLFAPLSLRSETNNPKTLVRQTSLILAGNVLGALSVLEVIGCSYLLMDALMGKSLSGLPTHLFSILALTAFSCYSKQAIVEHYQSIRVNK